MSYQSINPATNEVIRTYDYLPDTELEQKIIQAHETFLQWRKVSYAERSDLLLQAAARLEEKKEYHARLITTEMGKPIKQSMAEIEKCITACTFYAKNTDKFLVEEKKKSTAHKSYIRYEPMGLILAIMPWNFPYWQVFRYITPNFMAGNVSFLKHASNVP
jgi:succinate-semialdehyde dehydrogenase/glutarate-semialdehyde dehydrogenase